jgi:restriction endonuclease Mrr
VAKNKSVFRARVPYFFFHGARKTETGNEVIKSGIFITTSRFAKGAREYVEKIDNTIILIDGQRLVELMMEFNIGVPTNQVFELKRLDSDYFEE